MLECAAILGNGESAESDAREILATVLNVTRFWPAAHPTESVCATHREMALRAARSRASGMPIQYATGRAAFRHITLTVDRSVLIPRPETELLVDIVLARHTINGGTLADIGTGSGAIAIALAMEGRFDRVIATDISESALKMAEMNAASNAARLRCRIDFRAGSMLDPLLGEELDVLVSNPPYIRDSEMAELPPDVRDWEPRTALASGHDGLEATRRILQEAPAVLVSGGLIALEVDARRAGASADILRHDDRYTGVEIIADLAGRPRFIAATRR